jgi:hypothetical protein
MVGKRKSLPALALALWGCAASVPQAPVVARVPVPIECPEPPLLPLPQLPIASLKAGAPPAEVAKAYAASVQVLKDAVKERELLLDAYRSRASGNGAEQPSQADHDR